MAANVAFCRLFAALADDADGGGAFEDRWLGGFADRERRNTGDAFGYPRFVLVSLVLS
jgi:hypothetical protein